jgi:hypothetical protein
MVEMSFLKIVRPLLVARWTLVLCTTIALGAVAQQIPRVDEQNLAGHRVVLPDGVAGKVAVLVLGFTRASKEPSTAWAGKIQKDLGANSGVGVYSMPVLEDVPSLIRGVVISGIRRGVPENLRDHFVPVLHNEAEWKKLVSYKEPDDAYLVVLDRSGKIAYQAHGPLSDQSYAQLQQQVESLLK